MGLRKLLALIGGLVGTRVAGALAALFTQILLARSLPAQDMGTYFLVISLSSAFGILMSGGYPALGATYLARYHALGRNGLFCGFLGSARRDILLAAGAIMIAAAGFLFFAPLSQAARTALLIGLAVAPAVAFIQLQGAVANSTRRFHISFVPNFLLRPLALFIIVLAMLVVMGRLVLDDVLAAYLVLAYLIAALQAFLLWPQGAVPIGQPVRNRGLRAAWRGRAASLVVVTLVGVAFADVVVLVAGMFMPAADVAIVGVCMRLAVLVGFVTQASHQFVLPDLTRAMASGRHAAIRAVLLRANLVSLSVAGAAFLGALALGDYALLVFGQNYASGHMVLVIVLVSQILRAASGMNVHLLSLGAQQARTASVCVLSLVVLVMSAAVLAPRYGSPGMALAVVVADLVWVLGGGFVAHRKLARRGDILAVLSSSSCAVKRIAKS